MARTRSTFGDSVPGGRFSKTWIPGGCSVTAGASPSVRSRLNSASRSATASQAGL
jgi:hypothetical protein